MHPGGDAAAAGPTVEVDGRRLRLSNLDKVLYPESGTTKGEVIDYVARVAPVQLPHLTGRPVTRIRWPHGVDGASFFAKDIEPGAPGWLRREGIDHSGGAKAYPVVEDTAGLIYLAQTASLELHVPQWRFDGDGRRLPPDRLVLDLDPGPGVGLPECAAVARAARPLLQDLGMDPVPVTSGSKGLHLYARLEGDRGSDQISAFAHELARILEADHPDLVVSRMSKTLRPGRVFLDWSQNNGSKTTIAPYSLRGTAQPTVAAPRTWEELDDPKLAQVRFSDIPGRMETLGDPLAAILPPRHDLLAAYTAKRTAARTPEPTATTPAAAGSNRFVIQEHHARRLHFDLRLEHDGVLVSWAVPRGLPSESGESHLAVMTEPHPLAYLDFEGEIPRGEYGAGTMTVWDTGTYTAEKWRDDEVIFVLHGRRPDAEGSERRYALIRTQGAGEKSQWLLHRMAGSARRESARATSHPRASHAPAGPVAVSPAPMLAAPATESQADSAASRWGTPWVEFKWDGMRAIGTWDGHRLRLRARSGAELTARYPELTEVDLGLGPEPCLLDGEIVALGPDGRPSFSRLQRRMHLTKEREIRAERERTPVSYFLFDLLAHGEWDAMPLPLAQRRELLESTAAGAPPVIVVPPVADDVSSALRTARQLRLEGIVAKNPASPYRPGTRSDEWLKVKISHTRDVIIGGIRPGRGDRQGQIGSLLLGIPTERGLHYAGRVGTGFSERTLTTLATLLDPLRTDENPFLDVPDTDARDADWVTPTTIGEVEFAEFSPGGHLRHARWRGLRPDLTRDDVEPF